MKIQSGAVFLDRDGVLNEIVYRDGKPGSPRSIEEFHILDTVDAALERMRQAGCMLFVVTNQPDVARGLLRQADLALMTDRLRQALPVDDIVTCPHDDEDACSCRKPKPGMLQSIASSFRISLRESFMIGDSWKDMQAGKAAGCTCILLRRSYNPSVEAHFLVDDLHEAAEVILARWCGRRPEGTYVQKEI